MKNLLNVCLLSMTLLFLALPTFAQDDSDSKLEFSGSADVYFRANLSADNDAPTPVTSFANLPGFSLGMFNLIGSYEKGDVGVVGDLVFGPRGVDAVFASGAPLNIVNQLYAYWNVNENVTLTMGNFNTFLGYEVISPTGNFNYSTSYMFSYGPFSHSGIKADFSLSDDLSLMLGVFNPTDLTDFNPFGSYTFGAQLGYKGIYLNLLYGDQDGSLDEDKNFDGDVSAGDLFQIDLTAGFDLTDDIYFGINATYNATTPGEELKGTTISDLDGDASSFFGVAGYLQFGLSESFALGLRAEYFGEGNGGYGIIGAYDSDFDASIFELTLSGNISIDNLTIIPEFRIDSASEDVFLNSDQEASNSLASFILAAVYAF